MPTPMTTALLKERRPARTRVSTRQSHAPHWNHRAVINAPLEEVIADFMTRSNENEGPVCQVSGTTDPTYTCLDYVLGRTMGVLYTFYAVPGGTQVDAVIDHAPMSLTHPRSARALRRERHRVSEHLAAVKDHLE